MEITLVIIILLIVLAECSAQAYANRYHHEQKIHLYLVAVGFYGIVVYLLSRAHGYTTMSTANGIWSGLSVLAVAITGLMFFKQKVSPSEWVALFLIGCSVSYLIMVGVEPEP